MNAPTFDPIADTDDSCCYVALSDVRNLSRMGRGHTIHMDALRALVDALSVFTVDSPEVW